MRSMTLRLPALLAATFLASCASSPAPMPPPAREMGGDPAKLDIANVKLGMDADQVMAALRQSFGQTIMDWRVTDQSYLDVVRVNKDLNYPRNKIFYSMNTPAKSSDDFYISHIFYNIQDVYVGKTSIIVDLAKPPGQPNGPARVYQVLEVTRAGLQGPVFTEVSERAAGKYGVPTQGNRWCAGLVDGKCPSDKPYLALYLIKEPVQAIKSVLQLYDPTYQAVGPEAIGSIEDVGALSFERHTRP